MSTPEKPLFLWLDLETTGLDPKHCRVLEIGAKLVEDPLEEIPAFIGPHFHRFVSFDYQTEIDTAALERIVADAAGSGFQMPTGSSAGLGTSFVWDDFRAYEMHLKNGLLTYCRSDQAVTLAEANHEFALWLSVVGKRKVYLCGSSVHFDRSFVDVRLPAILPYLSFRILDVASFRLLGQARGLPVPPKRESVHRSLDDIRASQAELTHWVCELAGDFNVGPV